MEKNINNIPIQSLWIGGQLSKVEQLCIQSFIDNGHEFHLYVYEEITNAPKYTQIFDARTIIAEDAIFRFESGWGKGSVSGFADLFRLLLIQKKGGWWVDMDVICLRPFDFKEEIIICSSYESEYGSLVNNCVFKFPAGSFFIKSCLEQLAGIDLKKMNFGDAGPFLFQRMVKELELENYVVPYHFFNPISWKFIHELILDKMTTINKVKEIIRPFTKPKTMLGRKIEPDSYAVHFWNEVWRYNHFNKNVQYNNFCRFEKLKRKHGIK